jgi:hypothetical protein
VVVEAMTPMVMDQADWMHWRLYVQGNELARKEYDKVSAREAWPDPNRFRRKKNTWASGRGGKVYAAARKP